jgi:hypothetical protein
MHRCTSGKGKLVLGWAVTALTIAALLPANSLAADRRVLVEYFTRTT